MSRFPFLLVQLCSRLHLSINICWVMIIIWFLAERCGICCLVTAILLPSWLHGMFYASRKWLTFFLIPRIQKFHAAGSLSTIPLSFFFFFPIPLPYLTFPDICSFSLSISLMTFLLSSVTKVRNDQLFLTLYDSDQLLSLPFFLSQNSLITLDSFR